MAQRDLVDRILEGRLRDELQALKNDDRTYDQMARHFEDEHSIKVSRETVRRWCIELGLEAA